MIENWSFWEPSWVAVDVHAFRNTEDELVYQGVINICLDEGGIDDEIKCITVSLGVYSKLAGACALNAFNRVDAAFETVAPIITVYDEHGAEEAEINMNEIVTKLFEKIAEHKEPELEVFEDD